MTKRKSVRNKKGAWRVGPSLNESNAKFLIICTKCQNEWTKIDMIRRETGLPGIAVRIRCEHCGQTLELRRPVVNAKSRS